MINQVSLDEISNQKLSSEKLLTENEKVQEDLAFKLRNLIANFCDEHFVKYLKENKNSEKLPAQQDTDKPVAAEENKINEETITEVTGTTKLPEETSNSVENVEMIDIVSPANSTECPKEITEPVTKTTGDLNLTSTSSLTPPRSSYSSTSSSSSSSSSPSSEINNHQNSNNSDDVTNKSIEQDPELSVEESAEKSADNTQEEKSTNQDNNSTTLNDVIDKLEIIDHASKSIKEIANSAELNHHRLQHMALQKEELDTQGSALEKLWSQILIGADKLEIFGSIHVRSNNVRLFSCLIDEQLHIDNQSFSSASSCVSQDSCSSKILIKKNNSKLNHLRSKNLYKYERQLYLSNYYRKKIHHDATVYNRHHRKSHNHQSYCPDKNFYDLDHSGYNHFYHQKHHQKQQKLAKKVEDLVKAVSPEHNKKVDDHYPMKKFKAYHSYCSNKRKSAGENNKSDTNNNKEQTQSNENNNVVTSLSSLATVAAAAMRLSPSTENSTSPTNTETSPAPVKKSRKSSVTNSIKQQSINSNKDLDADTELEIDEEDDFVNNSLLIDQPNKINDFYLYEGEEDFEDTSSVLSATSSFTSSHSMYEKSQNKTQNDHSHRRQHSAHSRSSSFGDNSRSISLNGDCLSRSPSKIPANINTAANHRSISPASSLASSSFDYDDEQVYQSYCSSSSFKSDFEDEYNNQNDEFANAKKYHRRHSRKHKKHNENEKPINQAANNETEDTMVEEKTEIHNSNVNSSSRHYHRRKQHLIDAEHKDTDDVIQSQFKTEKDTAHQESQIQMQQGQLKLQQLPKLLGLQQQQHAELQAQHAQQLQEEEARKNDEYLARKYKYNRRFAPYNNNNNANNQSGNNQSSNSFSSSDNTNNNLYLLASSRHHHRMSQSESNGQDSKSNGQYQNGHSGSNSSSKLMSVNSLVDRLSPISDPDMERANGQQKRSEMDQSKIHNGANANEIHILNRINNLSPSSSSSSSSSNKNHQNASAVGQLGQMFHHNSMQQQAVLAAASQSGSSSHNHLNGHPNQHAQSVAALLANMQHDQSHNSPDVAKVLASLNQHHHLNQHNPHTQQIINRFSNNPSQSELMAAVLAQQQQQQNQLLERSNQFNMNPNGQLYSRYSHLNAAVAAAAAAAASNAANGHNSRRAHSVESDAHTPSPPATTPANGNGTNGSSLSSSSSSSSSTSSENYNSSKYSMHDRNDDICKKERSSSVTSHSNEPNGNGGEKVRLVPGFDVFISTNDLNACNDDRGSATRLLRNLMDVFFDKSTLAKSSINGTGRITNTLDKHIISALFAYVKNRYQDVPHSQLTRAATDKCVQTRRNFRKKIKAAQSYFGMFPSM